MSRLHNVMYFIAKHILNISHSEHCLHTVTVNTCKQHYIDTGYQLTTDLWQYSHQ